MKARAAIAALLLTSIARVAHAQEDDDEDFGEELIWLDARAGYLGANLVAFDDDPARFTAGVVPTRLGGPAIDVGGGLRFWIVTIGPRVRLALFEEDRDTGDDSAQLWSADLEAGLRIPLGRVEPHLTIAGGYSGLGGLEIASQTGGDETLDVKGGNARAGAGVDVYLTENISLGADFSGELLVLRRESMQSDDPDAPTDSEASVGGALTGIGGVGFHF